MLPETLPEPTLATEEPMPTTEEAVNGEEKGHKIGEFTVPLGPESLERLEYFEQIGKGDQFRAIAKFLFFIPQYLFAVAFCALIQHGSIWIAGLVLIFFFDISMVKSFANFVFKSFKK